MTRLADNPPVPTVRQASTLRPPRIVKLLNPIAKALLRAGLPMGPNGLLTVTGRRTGLARTTPVAVIELDGRRWIWSPWGETHWVRNLRASGHATITVRGRAEEVRATELSAGERVSFFGDVLGPLARRVPFGATFIRIADGVDLGRPREAADGRIVFELQRVVDTVSRSRA